MRRVSGGRRGERKWLGCREVERRGGEGRGSSWGVEREGKGRGVIGVPYKSRTIVFILLLFLPCFGCVENAPTPSTHDFPLSM